MCGCENSEDIVVLVAWTSYSDNAEIRHGNTQAAVPAWGLTGPLLLAPMGITTHSFQEGARGCGCSQQMQGCHGIQIIPFLARAIKWGDFSLHIFIPFLSMFCSS